MATKDITAEELIEVLKFTPRTYQLLIQGYGGESYAGRVDRKIYDYFKAQKIDMDEYASSYDEFEGMPKEMQPFSPGSPYDCDGMFHASGAELSDLNSIELFDEKGDTHWQCTAGINDLEDQGVIVDEFSSTDFDDLEPGEVVFWGGQGEKGCFFDGEIHLTQPFDPKKLRIVYETCDGWSIINYVEYDGEEIDGSGGYSTTGKWGENKWILGGDEEVYDETVSAEDREDEGLTWGEVPESACTSELEDPPMPELPVTDWFPGDVKPVHKGEYECEFKIVTWPWPAVRMCEWTGRTWKDANGEKIKGEFKWRGLAIDPNTPVEFDWSPLPDYECVQCDWSGLVDEVTDNDGDLRCPKCGEPVESV